MTEAGVVHFVVPRGIDDPGRTSGGNVYDRRLAEGLTARGWDVRFAKVDAAASAVLEDLPRGALVLVDGLIARGAPTAIEAAATRLRIVVLAHMVTAAFPDADPRMVAGERRALRASRYVISTSEWTRDELVRRSDVPRERVVVAVPGTAEAPAAIGTPAGAALLCVGVVAPHKGQDVLIEALRALDARVSWTCTLAGSLDEHPVFVSRLTALGAGLETRLRMPGILAPDELEGAYRRTDLVVAPSRAEGYGMAIAEALGRGIPVVASAVGGIPQTVARSGAAVLVPPSRPAALSDALRRWLTDPGLRTRLKDAALRTRTSLPRWEDTVEQVHEALGRVR